MEELENKIDKHFDEITDEELDKELENKIDKHFDEIADEELDKDLKEAGYYFYRRFLVDINIGKEKK